ncbi:spliceosome-associated protein CWC27 homolog [Topomyia yanbarensis]|uniref:spliceosome-associated protein CWC27 homolog n=1 Tax=Topomyia yanbarensis TaxID=2498891 RepID=UPI00273B5E3C|nr:spliceosome-associated protein CWC27 homolog [Topomyia yanbarensis]
MSNIYIQEPPTTGKVLLKTTVGDIDIELWSRESPLACRNFVQLCMEGYYNGTMFHRVVRGFIVQGGDPNGDGTGGESIYGHPFKDEFHSRLRFVRRGLVAMANSGKNDNGSQFFFTLGATPELQNMHTLFGKVGGDTIYNMLKLEDGEVYENERPHFPHRILKTEILHNPFPDIVPRLLKLKKSSEDKKEKKKKEKGVKNYGLLSFGDEAEEEEQETNQFVQKNIVGKGKSSHDALDDPGLSKQAVDVKGEGSSKVERRDARISGNDSSSDNESACGDSRDKELIEQEARNIRDKLKRKKEAVKPIPKDISSDSDSDFGLDSERKKVKQQQAAKIREQISQLKKDYQSDKRKDKVKVQQDEVGKKKNEAKSEVMKEFLAVQEQYTEKKKQLPKKGSSRENFTLQLLEKFKNKLQNVHEQVDETVASGSQTEMDEEADIQSDNWLSHRLQFEKNDPILAKDAVTKDDGWYDVYDPRNPLNKRKRGEKVDTKEKPQK